MADEDRRCFLARNDGSLRADVVTTQQVHEGQYDAFSDGTNQRIERLCAFRRDMNIPAVSLALEAFIASRTNEVCHG
jgi:hypothetical protein